MKSLSKTFVTGMATVLPMVLTVYVLYWFAATVEAALGEAIQLVLPARLYWPGMGLAIGLVLIFLVGLLMHAWVVRKLIELGEGILYRVPLVKSVYGSIRDFFTLFSTTAEGRPHQSVMVRLGDTGMEVLGFVMREDFSALPPGLGHEDSVAVYLPLSYQIGGYTVILPRAALRPVDIPMEQAMRFAITGGLTTAKGGPTAGAERDA
ncbi:MAG: DUF502 domain-containing protein [Gammaproteobacteria bacterium]|nr:DUF502 domain-containing protein [Gammaproteobacteria bacterium]NIR98884.1 DUF502 domain-containing protein [Gammaproteobacteria bacterium]NIT64005.1 DUF502 domain-containing protein [Gammaproteobacteria bacterium]NIV19165.1 DUF502 domain-containing protein [Gammaproteobacteria bacterium]NIX10334.1 DUF502 domain-containing protein [Gammaproteobacteria bacterium]